MPAVYTDVPVTWPPPGDRRRRELDVLLQAAGERTTADRPVSLALFSDSRFTVPGSGQHSVSILNHLLAAVYGNTPATPWSIGDVDATQGWMHKPNAGQTTAAHMTVNPGFYVHPITSAGSDWLQTGNTSLGVTIPAGNADLVIGCYVALETSGGFPLETKRVIAYDPNAGGGTTPRLTVDSAWGVVPTASDFFRLWPDDPTRFPPGQRPSRNNWSSIFGAFILVDIDASGQSVTQLRHRHWKLPANLATGTATGEVVLTSLASSSNARALAKPTSSATLSWGATTTATITIASGAAMSSAEFKAARYNVSLPYSAGNTHMQFAVIGDAATPPVNVAAVRVLNNEDRTGIVATTFSRGGYNATDLRGKHGNSGPVLTAQGFDLALVIYDANDSPYYTAAQFKANQQLNIDWLRSQAGITGPIILAGTPWRTGLTAGQLAEFDQYPGAMMELAQDNRDVLAINLRRMTETAFNWNSAGYATYAPDGVHFSEAGARLLMELLVAEIMGVPSWYARTPQGTFRRA